MKKILSFVLVACFCLCAFATVKPIVGFNPAFRISTLPTFNIVTPESQVHNVAVSETSTSYETAQDLYYRYFNQLGLIDLGIAIDDEHFDMVLDIDVREQFSYYCRNNSYSNIPYVGNRLSAVTDFNFPRIAFGEITFDNFFASIGRRPIGWGPAKHNTAISSDVPFLDHLWIDYKTPMAKGNLGYNFVAVSFNSEALLSHEEKTLVAHKFSWANDNVRVSLGELNMVYTEYPNLLDISPFGVFHNLFQDRKSNVMLALSAEGKIANIVRIYGQFSMDDFDVPGEREKNNGKPGAIAYGAGLQFHVLDGVATKTFDNSVYKYALNEDSFKFTSGLNLSLEYYFCSPYMYNRADESGKFTVPVKMYGSPSTVDSDAMYLGFKYGPNSMFGEFSAEYATEKLSLGASAALLVRGSDYNISSPYGKEAVVNGDIDYDYRFKIYGDKISTLMFGAQAKYLYSKGMEVFADVDFSYQLNNKVPAISATLGTSINLF